MDAIDAEMTLVPDTHPLSILMNIEDPETYITKKEAIEALTPSNSAIDIVGVVKSFQSPYTAQKDNRTLQVFNFVLECDTINLPVAVWDEDIERIKPFVQRNMIIHLDSPFTRPQAPSKWTCGKNFILTCRSNTIINTLGKMKSEILVPDEKYEEFASIEDSLTSLKDNTPIVLNVVIKTEFLKENDRSNRRIGAVTDKVTKLTVYIMDYNTNVILENGEHVKMKGPLIEASNKIHFEIKSSEDIKKVGGEKVSEDILENVFRTPKRKMNSQKKEDESKADK